MQRLWHILILALSLGAAPVRAEVLIFAAASLKEPLDTLMERSEGITVSYAGSGTLARQVQLGAPPDLILLANTTWMDALIETGSVDPVTVADFASNRLVLVGPRDADPVPLTSHGFERALQGGRLAIGLTEAVPAGIYAKAALQSLGLWDAVSGNLAEVDSVRAALTLVDRGQTRLGIVYTSDVRVAPDLAVLASFPPGSHPPIRYQGALTPNAGDEARAFWGELTGQVGQGILAQSGFLPPVVETDR